MIGIHSSQVKAGVRLATPLALLVGVYLLFAGHNQPGGGFAAGLVFGAVVALRTIAGLRPPIAASSSIAVGVFIAALVAVAPLVTGDVLLDQSVWTMELPVLGKLKSGSAFVFDIGVTAIVVGLVVAVLDGLGGDVLGGDLPGERSMG